jgi:dipeptide/tripeptide permease
MYLAALPGGWLADNWLGQQKAVSCSELSLIQRCTGAKRGAFSLYAALRV